MSNHRSLIENFRGGRFLLLVMVCAIGTLSLVEKSFGEEPTSLTATPTDEQIGEWIRQLESDSYASRQLAFRLLQPHAATAIPAVERAIEVAEEDAADRLIRLLGQWSEYPDDGYGREAFAALSRVAQGGVSARSSMAQRSIVGIEMIQSDRAIEYLSRLSAYIGLEQNRLFSMNMQYDLLYVLRIDEAFRGSIEDLNCVRWLSDVQVVRLAGPRIDRHWLEMIVKLPNLRILQIRRASITSEDLNILHALDRLDGLEILYTPIDDSSIEILGNLPLWGKLRLFGTEISANSAEQLRKQMEGSEVMFGLGGFLGVGSKPDDLVINHITAGGGAEKAGLRELDRIIRVQGVKLEKFVELRAELAKYPPGATVTLEFERLEASDPSEGPKMVSKTVEVILGEQPEQP